MAKCEIETVIFPNLPGGDDGGDDGDAGALYNKATGRFYTKSTASSVSEASSVDEDEVGAVGTAAMQRTESGRSDVSELTDYSAGDGPFYAVGDRVLALFDDEVSLRLELQRTHFDS